MTVFWKIAAENWQRPANHQAQKNRVLTPDTKTPQLGPFVVKDTGHVGAVYKCPLLLGCKGGYTYGRRARFEVTWRERFMMYYDDISIKTGRSVERIKPGEIGRVYRRQLSAELPPELHDAIDSKASDFNEIILFRSVRGSKGAYFADTPDYSDASSSIKMLGFKDKPSFRATKSVDDARDSSYSKKMNSSLDIYNGHFHLDARPFSLVPDPEFLFWSTVHRRAYTMLEYGTLTGSPITLITGEVGAGKTTLLHKFLSGIGDDLKIGLVSNAHGSRGELLRWVLMSLDQPADRDATYVDLFDAFQKYLIQEYAAGNRVLLVFDEAQNLSIESLEELRMFTNINSNKDELLQLVLVGQPELRDTIHRPELRQFAQRIAASFHLSAMDEKTVTAYIGHRLRVAGAKKNLFAEAACKLVHQHTGGVPRLVNQLCDLSMVYAFTKDQKTITSTTVEDVLKDGIFFAAGNSTKDPSE